MEYKLSKNAWASVQAVSLTNEIPHLPTYDILNGNLKNEWAEDFIGQTKAHYDDYESIKLMDGVASQNYSSDPVTFIDTNGNIFEGELPKINFEVSGAFEIEMDYLMHEMHRYLFRLYPEHKNALYTLTDAERQSYFNETLHMLNSFWDTENLPVETTEDAFYMKHKFVTNITTARKYMGSTKEEDILIHLFGISSTFTEGAIYIDDKTDTVVALRSGIKENTVFNKLYRYYLPGKISTSFQEDTFANLSDDFTSFVKDIVVSKDLAAVSNQLKPFAATTFSGYEDSIVDVAVSILNNVLEYGAVDPKAGLRGTVSSSVTFEDFIADSKFYKYYVNKLNDDCLKFEYNLTLPATGGTHLLPVKGIEYNVKDVFEAEGKYFVEATRFTDLRTAKIIKLGEVVYNNSFIDWYTQLCMCQLKECYDNEPALLNAYTGCRRQNWNYQVLFELKDNTGKVITRSFLADEYRDNIPNMLGHTFGEKLHNDEWEPVKVWKAIQDPHDCEGIHFGWGQKCNLTIKIEIYTDERDVMDGLSVTYFETGLQDKTSMQGIPLLKRNAFTTDWFVDTGWHTKPISEDLDGGSKISVNRTYDFEEEFTLTLNTIETMVDGVMDYYNILSDALTTQVITKNSDDNQMVYFIRTYANKGVASVETYMNDMAINTSTLSSLTSYEEEVKAEAVEMYESEFVDDNLIRTSHDLRKELETAGHLEYMIIDSASTRHFGYITEAYIQNTYCYLKLGEIEPAISVKDMYVKDCYLYIKGQTVEEPETDTDETLRSSSVTAAAYDNKYYYEVSWDKLSEDNLRWYCDSFTSEYVSEYMTESFKSHGLYDPTVLTEYQSLVLVSCPAEYVKPLTALLDENKSLYIDSSIKFVMHVPLIQGTTAHSREYGTISAMYKTTIPTYLSFYDIDVDKFEDFKGFVEGVENPDMKDITFVENIVNRSLIVWGTSIWDGNRSKTVEALRTVWGGYLSSFIVKDLREYLPDSYKSMHTMGTNSSVSVKLDNYNYSANNGEIEKNWNLVYSPNAGINSTMHVNIVNLTPSELASDDNWLYHGADDVDKRKQDLISISNSDANLDIESTIETANYNESLKNFNIEDTPLVLNLQFLKDYSFSVEYKSLPKVNGEQVVPDLQSDKFELRLENSKVRYKLLKNMDNIIHVPSYWHPRSVFQIADKTIETFLEYQVYRTWIEKSKPESITIKDVADFICTKAESALPYICYIDEEKEIFRLAIFDPVVEGTHITFNIYDIGIPPSMVLIDKLFTEDTYGNPISECSGITFSRTGALNKVINVLAPTIYNIPAQQFTGRFDSVDLHLTTEDGKELNVLDSSNRSRYEALQAKFANGDILTDEETKELKTYVEDYGAILFDESNQSNYGKVEKTIKQGHQVTISTDPTLGKIVTVKNPTKLVVDGKSDAKEMFYILQENNLYFKEYTDEVVELSAGTAVDGIKPCTIDFPTCTCDKFEAGDVLYLYDIRGSVPRSIYSEAKEMQVIDRNYEITEANVAARSVDGKTFYLMDNGLTASAKIENVIDALTPLEEYTGEVQAVNSSEIILGYRWAYPKNNIGYTYYKRKFITSGKILSNDPNAVILDDTTIVALEHAADGDNVEIMLLDSPIKSEEGASGVSLDISFDGMPGPYKYLTAKTTQMASTIDLTTTTSSKSFYVSCAKGIIKITYKDGEISVKLFEIANCSKYNFFVKSFAGKTAKGNGDIIYAAYMNGYNMVFEKVFDTSTDTLFTDTASCAIDRIEGTESAFTTPDYEDYETLDPTWGYNDPSSVDETGTPASEPLFTSNGATNIELHNVSRLGSDKLVVTDKLDRKYLVTDKDGVTDTWEDRTFIGDPALASEYDSKPLDSEDVKQCIKNWFNSMYGVADQTKGASYLKIPQESESPTAMPSGTDPSPTDLAYLAKVIFTTDGITAINAAYDAYDKSTASAGMTIDEAWNNDYIIYPNMQETTVSVYNNLGITNRQCKKVNVLSKGTFSIKDADDDMLNDLYKALCAEKVSRYINRVDAFDYTKSGETLYRAEWDQEACTVTYWSGDTSKEGKTVSRIALDKYLAIKTITPTNVYTYSDVLYDPQEVPGDGIWYTYWNAVKDESNVNLRKALVSLKADFYLKGEMQKLMANDSTLSADVAMSQVMQTKAYLDLANADFDINDFRENYFAPIAAAEYLNPGVMSSIDINSPYSIRSLYNMVKSYSMTQDDLNDALDEASAAEEAARATNTSSPLYQANRAVANAENEYKAASDAFNEVDNSYKIRFSAYNNKNIEKQNAEANLVLDQNEVDNREYNLDNAKAASGLSNPITYTVTKDGKTVKSYLGNVHGIRSSIDQDYEVARGNVITAKGIMDANFETLKNYVFGVSGNDTYPGIEKVATDYNNALEEMGTAYDFNSDYSDVICRIDPSAYKPWLVANDGAITVEENYKAEYIDYDTYKSIGVSGHLHSTNKYYRIASEIAPGTQLSCNRVYGYKGGNWYTMYLADHGKVYDTKDLMYNTCPLLFVPMDEESGQISTYSKDIWATMQAAVAKYVANGSAPDIPVCSEIFKQGDASVYLVPSNKLIGYYGGNSDYVSNFANAKGWQDTDGDGQSEGACTSVYGIEHDILREYVYRYTLYTSRQKVLGRNKQQWIDAANTYKDYCDMCPVPTVARDVFTYKDADLQGVITSGRTTYSKVGAAIRTFNDSWADCQEKEMERANWAGYQTTFNNYTWTYTVVKEADIRGAVRNASTTETISFKESDIDNQVSLLTDKLNVANTNLAEQNALVERLVKELCTMAEDIDAWKAENNYEEKLDAQTAAANTLAAAKTTQTNEQLAYDALLRRLNTALHAKNTAVSENPLPYPWTARGISEEEYLKKDAKDRLQVWVEYLEEKDAETGLSKGKDPLPSEWGTAAKLRASFEFGSTVPSSNGRYDWADINSYFNAGVGAEGYKNSIYPDGKVLSWDNQKLNVVGATRRIASDRQYIQSLVSESNMYLEGNKLIISGSLKFPTANMTDVNGAIDATDTMKDIWGTFAGGQTVDTDTLKANADSPRPFLLEVDLDTGDVSVPTTYNYDNSNGDVATIKSVTRTSTGQYTVLYQSVLDSTKYKVVQNLATLVGMPNTILATDNGQTFNSNVTLEPFEGDPLFDWSSLSENLTIATTEFLVAGAEYVNGMVSYIKPSDVATLGDTIGVMGAGIAFDNVESIRVLIFVSNKEKNNFQGLFGESEAFSYVPEALSIFEVNSSDFADFASYTNLYDFSASMGSREDIFLSGSYPWLSEFGSDGVYNEHIKHFYSIPEQVKDPTTNVYVKNANNAPEILTNKYGQYLLRILPIGFRLPGKTAYTEIEGNASGAFSSEGYLMKSSEPDSIFKKANGKWMYWKSGGTWAEVSADEENPIDSSALVPSINSLGKTYDEVRVDENPAIVYKLVSDPRRALISYVYKTTREFSISNPRIELQDGYIKLSLDNKLSLTGSNAYNPDVTYQVANAKHMATSIPNNDGTGNALYDACAGSVTIMSLKIKITHRTKDLPKLKPITDCTLRQVVGSRYASRKDQTKYSIGKDSKGNDIWASDAWSKISNGYVLEGGYDEVVIPRGGYGQVLIGAYQYPCMVGTSNETPNFNDGVFYTKGSWVSDSGNGPNSVYIVDPDTLERTGLTFANIRPVYNSFKTADAALPVKLPSTKEIEGLLPTFLTLDNVTVDNHTLSYSTLESLPEWRFRDEHHSEASAGIVDYERLYELFIAGLTFNCKMVRKNAVADTTNNTRIASYKEMADNETEHNVTVAKLKQYLDYTRVYAGDTIKDAPMFTKYYDVNEHRIKETGGQSIPDGDRYLCNSSGQLYKVSGYGALEAITTDYGTGYLVSAPAEGQADTLFEFADIFRDFTYTNTSKQLNCLYADTGITFTNKTFEVNGMELKFANNQNFQSIYTFKPLVKCVPTYDTLTRPSSVDTNDGLNLQPPVVGNDAPSAYARHTSNYYSNLSYGVDISFSTVFEKYNYVVMRDKNGDVVGTVYMKDYFNSDYVLILSNI